MLCRKGALRDLRHRNTHVFREILQEGTAACRAGLIDNDIRDDTVIQPDCLHVLAADIQNKCGVLQIFGAGSGMSHSLDNMRVGPESFCRQKLSVTRGRHALYMQGNTLFGKLFLHLNQALFQDRDGIASVICIERIQNPLFFIHKDKFGRGAAAVDAQITLRVRTHIEPAENMLVLI